MSTPPEDNNELVLSFLAVRRALGLLGFFLPLSLLAVAFLTSEDMRPSISEFYYTRGRELFTGTLCAIAVFLWAYVGYPAAPADGWLTDRQVSRVASVAALGVAFIPTENKFGDAVLPGASANCTLVQCALGTEWARTLHYGAAAVFFACLALFCLVLFRRSVPGPPTRGKVGRDRIYAVCGWTIVGCILALGAYGLGYARQDPPGQDAYDATRAVFILETIGVFAFAVSWLVKGETLKPLQKLAEPRA
ncbi:MAG: hypothetical protein ACT4OK_18970 [Gemmobacter sp.]